MNWKGNINTFWARNGIKTWRLSYSLLTSAGEWSRVISAQNILHGRGWDSTPPHRKFKKNRCNCCKELGLIESCRKKQRQLYSRCCGHVSMAQWFGSVIPLIPWTGILDFTKLGSAVGERDRSIVDWRPPHTWYEAIGGVQWKRKNSLSVNEKQKGGNYYVRKDNLSVII